MSQPQGDGIPIPGTDSHNSGTGCFLNTSFQIRESQCEGHVSFSESHYIHSPASRMHPDPAGLRGNRNSGWCAVLGRRLETDDSRSYCSPVTRIGIEGNKKADSGNRTRLSSLGS